MADIAFEEWAVVGLMGHQRIAGLVREVNIAGSEFIRVDVPEVEGEQAFSRIFGASAIYSIDPVTEITAKAVAQGIKASPVRRWDVSPLLDEISSQAKSRLTSGDDDYDDDYDGEIPL